GLTLRPRPAPHHCPRSARHPEPQAPDPHPRARDPVTLTGTGPDVTAPAPRADGSGLGRAPLSTTADHRYPLSTAAGARRAGSGRFDHCPIPQIELLTRPLHPCHLLGHDLELLPPLRSPVEVEPHAGPGTDHHAL